MNKKFKYILLIDDDSTTNFIHQKLIEKIDCSENTRSFINGREALDFIEISLNQQKKPMLIFLDINMPVMNGWQFLDAYNSLPEESRSGITIAMATVSPDPEDIALAKEKNINHYLNKPIDRSSITNLIEKLLKN